MRKLYDETTTVITVQARGYSGGGAATWAFNVWVFGWVARGVVDESSDIDLLVDYDLQKIPPWFPEGLFIDLQDILGCKVDIMTELGLSRLINDRVLADAKSLVKFTIKEAV